MPTRPAPAVNTAPAPAAKSANATEDTPLNITGLLDGVTDPNPGDTVFTLVNASSPAHGTLSGLDAGAGQVTYTPALNYNGPDSFEYTVADDSGATGVARVTITIGGGGARRCHARLYAAPAPSVCCLPLHSAGT
jgi:hypothetical protein